MLKAPSMVRDIFSKIRLRSRPLHQNDPYSHYIYDEGYGKRSLRKQVERNT
jgi:hypothetical protein